MNGPFSERLTEVLDLKRQRLSDQVDLKALGERVALLFGDDADTVKTLMAHLEGSKPLGALCTQLTEFIPNDSVVRDMCTAGHLAKLLTRLHVARQIQDHRVFGLPNGIFDSLSWQERTDYFKKGVTHDIDPEIFERPEVAEMLRREAAVLRLA
jgi:hypothetical protein